MNGLHRKRKRKYSIKLLLLLILIFTLSPAANAQEAISLNDTKIGQIAGAGTAASYNFVAQQGQSVNIEIIAASDGLAPQFSIYNANNALVQTIGNPELGLVVENTMTFAQAGVYRIEVSSATGAVGQFVIQLHPGTAPIPAVALMLNTPVNNSLAINESAVYGFNANGQSATVIEISTNGTGGMAATLKDTNGTIIGALGGALTGGRFDVPPGQSAYRLELANDGSLSALVAYQVTLLAGAPGQPIAPPPTQEPITPPTDTPPTGSVLPTLPQEGPCVIATATDTSVNIRAGTSTDFGIVGRMDPQVVYTVSAVNPERSWYYIAFDGSNGWVAASVTRTGGSCGGVGVIAPPSTSTPAATSSPVDVTPTLISTPTVSQLDAMCRFNYNPNAFMNMNDMTCYSCPPNYTQSGRELGASTLSCNAQPFAEATIHGRATGLIGTDCPAGSGQFFDPNGYCYSCPIGYNRTVYSVNDERACQYGGGAAPAPTRLGILN